MAIFSAIFISNSDFNFSEPAEDEVDQFLRLSLSEQTADVTSRVSDVTSDPPSRTDRGQPKAMAQAQRPNLSLDSFDDFSMNTESRTPLAYGKSGTIYFDL